MAVARAPGRRSSQVHRPGAELPGRRSRTRWPSGPASWAVTRNPLARTTGGSPPKDSPLRSGRPVSSHEIAASRRDLPTPRGPIRAVIGRKDSSTCDSPRRPWTVTDVSRAGSATAAHHRARVGSGARHRERAEPNRRCMRAAARSSRRVTPLHQRRRESRRRKPAGVLQSGNTLRPAQCHPKVRLAALLSERQHSARYCTRETLRSTTQHSRGRHGFNGSPRDRPDADGQRGRKPLAPPRQYRQAPGRSR